MKIQLHEISIAELVAGYSDDGDDGVRGYGGRLDIRPPYQREFVYKEKQRNAVIESIKQDFPLNVMYWSARGDGTFEIIDGQQRTISISQYMAGRLSRLTSLYFHNLPADIKERVLRLQIDDLSVQRHGQRETGLVSGQSTSPARPWWSRRFAMPFTLATLGDGCPALFQQARLPGLSDWQRLSARLVHSAGLSGDGYQVDQRRRRSKTYMGRHQFGEERRAAVGLFSRGD